MNMFRKKKQHIESTHEAPVTAYDEKYNPTITTIPKLTTQSPTPPPYTSESAARDLQLLLEGDPSEIINVPMIHSDDSKSLADYLRFRNVGTVTRRVIMRRMTRALYLERYAKDANGEFIGTGRPAPDAGLVFVPSKGTPDELLRQVKEAVGTRNTDPYGAGATMGPAAFIV